MEKIYLQENVYEALQTRLDYVFREVKSTIDIPSWKRMCACILKNDHLCRFMGFGPTKPQQEQIRAIKKKYAALIRGKEAT